MRELISEYQSITCKITNLRERIASIYSAAASAKIRIITDMPMAPGFSGTGLDDTFVRIEELQESIADYNVRRDIIAAHIETRLDLAGVSGIERAVFWYREVYGLKWWEIAVKTGKSVRTLQRISKKPIYMSLLL